MSRNPCLSRTVIPAQTFSPIPSVIGLHVNQEKVTFNAESLDDLRCIERYIERYVERVVERVVSG